MLRWSPEQFWRASVWDVHDAQEGYAISKGILQNDGLTANDVRELQRMMDEHD